MLCRTLCNAVAFLAAYGAEVHLAADHFRAVEDDLEENVELAADVDHGLEAVDADRVAELQDGLALAPSDPDVHAEAAFGPDAAAEVSDDRSDSALARLKRRSPTQESSS